MKKDYDSTRIYRNTQKKGASQTYDTPSSSFLSKLEISDRIQLKIAFVFMIIQVKAIDTTSGVTAMGGLHGNFFIGIANIDSLPTATMILTISLSLPCPISRSQVFTLQNYDKRKPASTT